MGARAETLAKQFEAKAAEFTTTVESLTDAEWKKTSAEQWSIGVAAHHVAGAHEPIAGIVKAVATGGQLPGLSMADIDRGNAQHAKEHANCTKADTLAIHKKGVAAAAAAVRGLSDAELDRSAVILKDMPAMSAQQAIENILINHVTSHLDNIRSAVGR